MLLMETDGHPAVVAEEAEIMAQLAREQGAMEVRVAETAEEALRLATARRSAFAALARVAPTTILEDVTVPRSELAGMVRFIQDAGAAARSAHRHFRPHGRRQPAPDFPDQREGTRRRCIAWSWRSQEIVTETVRRGGTITGEHGVGLAKKKFLAESVGALNVELMAKLKRVLDPNWILNPGKMFESEPEGGERRGAPGSIGGPSLRSGYIGKVSRTGVCERDAVSLRRAAPSEIIVNCTLLADEYVRGPSTRLRISMDLKNRFATVRTGLPHRDDVEYNERRRLACSSDYIVMPEAGGYRRN